MKLEVKDLFLIIPKEEITIEPNSFVHCNMLTKDRTKYVLQYIGANSEEVLSDVETVLLPTKAVVTTPNCLVDICLNLVNHMLKLQKEGKLSKMENVIYNYLFEDEQPMAAPLPNPFVETVTIPDPFSGTTTIPNSSGFSTWFTSRRDRNPYTVAERDDYRGYIKTIDVSFSDQMLELLSPLAENLPIVDYLNSRYKDENGEIPNRLRVKEQDSTFIYFNGAWKRL